MAFLAEHVELADLLEPMVADRAGDDVTGPEPGPRAVPSGALPQISDYRIERELGRGGMGVVYRAVQTSLERAVALKLMTPVAVSERMRQRFLREAEILGRLEHPHIVRVLGAGAVDAGAFLALELIDGASLATVIDAVRRAGLSIATGATVAAALAGALAAADAKTQDSSAGESGAAAPTPFADRSHADVIASLGAQIAQALHYAHCHGVVHRDVKPSNILVRRDGRAVLSDFGVARDESTDNISQTNPLTGTPSSMAPEQVTGGTIDARTDVYGLGATLYEALTLMPPFTGNPLAMLVQIRQDEPADPRQLNPRLPADLVAIVGKAMAKAPGERYADADAMARDLRAFVAHEPVAARAPGPWRRLRRWLSKRPWRAAACVSAGLGVLAALAVAAFFSLRLLAETQRKSAALAEVSRLGLNIALDEAIAEADFAPPHSGRVPAMTAWLEQRAQPLLDELPALQQLLGEVRTRAEPYTASDAEIDRRTHPEAETLERLAFEAELAARATDASAVSAVRARIAEVEPRVESRRTWRFAQLATQFLHDQVAALVARLQVFAGPDGPPARVRAERDFLRYAAHRSLETGRVAWQQAIADIAAEPRYGGLRLEPSEDLLPLGRDPTSGLYEFVHLRSGTRGKEAPRRSAGGALIPDDDMGIVLVLLPGGTFTMGAQAVDAAAPNYDPMAGTYEGPVHTVTLSPFFIGKFELTMGQWRRLTGAAETSGWRVGDKLAGADLTWRHPAVNIAQAETDAALLACGLTLPTEAQWEYACRAGTSTPWSFGARADAAGFANFADVRIADRLPHCDLDLDDGYCTHAPVGSLAPNPFGLHDMHGNVSEWCCSRICLYDERPARAGDGQRETFLADEQRYESRGGSYIDRLSRARSADRWSHHLADVRLQKAGARASRACEVRQ